MNAVELVTALQAKLRACPRAYVVMVNCDGEHSIDAVYDSLEGAQKHRDWYNKHNRGGYLGRATVEPVYIRTMELANSLSPSEDK